MASLKMTGFTSTGNGGMIFVGLMLAGLWASGFTLCIYRLWRLLRERDQPLAVVFIPTKMLVLVAGGLYCVINIFLGDFFWYTSTSDASIQIAFTVLGEAIFRPVMVLSLCQLIGTRLSYLTQSKSLITRCGGIDEVIDRRALDDCLGVAAADSGDDSPKISRDSNNRAGVYRGMWRPVQNQGGRAGYGGSSGGKGGEHKRSRSQLLRVESSYYASSVSPSESADASDARYSPYRGEGRMPLEGSTSSQIPRRMGSSTVRPQRASSPGDRWGDSANDPAASTSDVASFHVNGQPQSHHIGQRVQLTSDSGSTVEGDRGGLPTPRDGAGSGGGGEHVRGDSEYSHTGDAPTNTNKLIALWHVSVANAKAYFYGGAPPVSAATPTADGGWEKGARWSSVLGTRLTLLCLVVIVPVYVGLSIVQRVASMKECGKSSSPPSDLDSCIALVAAGHFQVLRPRLFDSLAFFSYGVFIMSWCYCGLRYLELVTHRQTKAIAMRRFLIILAMLAANWTWRFFVVLDFARSGRAIPAFRFFCEVSEAMLVGYVAVHMGTVSGRSWGPKVQRVVDLVPAIPDLVPRALRDKPEQQQSTESFAQV